MAIIIVLLLLYLPLTTGMALSFILVAGWLVVINWLFDQGYWLSAVLPLAAAMPPAAFTVLILQSIAHRQTKTLTIARAELSRFQAPALTRMIAKDPTFC